MGQKALTENTLFYGDNLKILREYLADESVDLIYLDPPFNSARNHNVLFKDESGLESEAQITAFEDTWHWSERPYNELQAIAPEKLGQVIETLVSVLGRNQMTTYLVMMTLRLIELHRVLKPTGSLYLHCDPTASHYLKMILDMIFGSQNFRNEITWKRSSAHSDTKQGRKAFGNIADILLYYTKSQEYTFNPQFTPYDDEYIRTNYHHTDTNGRKWKSSDLSGPGGGSKGNPYFEFMGIKRYWRYSEKNLQKFLIEGRIYQSKPGAVPRMKHYLDEMPGIPLQNVWDDISPISSQAAERLGYPTQKPQALLERIISASSNEGDIVLDPFCGCGTTIHAAQKLQRTWLGMDITHLAIALIKNRLKDAFALEKQHGYTVIGEPEDLQGAQHLAEEVGRYQFQWWAVSLVGARPYGGDAEGKRGKKGADSGIDGIITFHDDPRGKSKRVIVQVKSGKVSVRDIRDLRGVIEREPPAALGVFITLQPPTEPMRLEAEASGVYHSSTWQKAYPKIRILTIAELLAGATVQMPPTATTYKRARKETPETPAQESLL